MGQHQALNSPGETAVTGNYVEPTNQQTITGPLEQQRPGEPSAESRAEGDPGEPHRYRLAGAEKRPETGKSYGYVPQQRYTCPPTKQPRPGASEELNHGTTT